MRFTTEGTEKKGGGSGFSGWKDYQERSAGGRPGELNRRGHREHGDKRRRNVSMLLAPASAGETQRHKGKHFDRKDHNNDAIATKGYAFSWRSLHLVCGSVISEPVEEGQ